MDYPNLKEILRPRRIAMLVVLCVLAAGLLAGGFYNSRRAAPAADPSAGSASLYAQNKAQAEALGQPFSEEDAAYWRDQDAARARRSALVSRVVCALDFTLGGLLALLCLYGIFRNDVRRSKLARSAARYAQALHIGDMAAALAQIEGELDDPLYDTPELTVTKHWIIGQLGATHKPVALPVRAVTGVYFYYLIRRVRGRRTEFFQMLFNDMFDQPVVLQLASKQQMEACYPTLLRCCPNAEGGNYSEEYKAYRALPPGQRQKRLETILQKNAEMEL